MAYFCERPTIRRRASPIFSHTHFRQLGNSKEDKATDEVSCRCQLRSLSLSHTRPWRCRKHYTLLAVSVLPARTEEFSNKMVRGLSDHLDLDNQDETSPTATASSRKSRRSTTPPHLSIGQPPPPPPPPGPPPGPPPSNLQQLDESEDHQRQLLTHQPAISCIVESGPATLSPAYRKKTAPRVITTDLSPREGPASLSLPSKVVKRSKAAPQSCQAALTDTTVENTPFTSQDTRIHISLSNHSYLEPHHPQQKFQRNQQHQQHSRNLQSPNSNMLMDTVRDLHTAASGTLASLREWGNNTELVKGFTTVTPKSTDGTDSNSNMFWPTSPRSALMRATSETMPKHILDMFTNQTAVYDDTQYSHPHGLPVSVKRQKPKQATILQDLAWPFTACGVDVGHLPNRQQLEPELRRVKDAMANAVNGDLKRANDIWRLAGQRLPPDGDDDTHSVGTCDTLQEEENNQIRRLASWGTINTIGTTETDTTSLGESKSMDMKLAREDDDGNVIDPLLLEKAQQAREKRQPRRTKLVKFDYPPIRSLRQCPRPNPADLPDLFFTENELDQIEDDRYSTMSTDDVEIVAVSSKQDDGEEPTMRVKGISSREAGKVSISGMDPLNTRDPPEAPLKPSKGRPSTPFRSSNRNNWGDTAGQPLARTTSGNDKRLVKGVQIYLRERSTGNV
jgi:hypothetical protein